MDSSDRKKPNKINPFELITGLLEKAAFFIYGNPGTYLICLKRFGQVPRILRVILDTSKQSVSISYAV